MRTSVMLTIPEDPKYRLFSTHSPIQVNDIPHNAMLSPPSRKHRISGPSFSIPLSKETVCRIYIRRVNARHGVSLAGSLAPFFHITNGRENRAALSNYDVLRVKRESATSSRKPLVLCMGSSRLAIDALIRYSPFSLYFHRMRHDDTGE